MLTDLECLSQRKAEDHSGLSREPLILTRLPYLSRVASPHPPLAVQVGVRDALFIGTAFLGSV